MAIATVSDLLNVATKVNEQLNKVGLLKPGPDNDLAQATLQACHSRLVDIVPGINKMPSPVRQGQTLFAASPVAAAAAVPNEEEGSRYRP